MTATRTPMSLSQNRSLVTPRLVQGFQLNHSLVTTRAAGEIVRSAYAAFAAGDVPAVLAVMSEDIAWRVAGRSPISGDYAGHDQVVGFFGTLVERSDGTFRVEVHEIFDNGAATAVALVTLIAERKGALLHVDAVHIWRLENGKATSFRDYLGDEYAHDEFWA